MGVFFWSISLNLAEVLRQNGKYCIVAFGIMDPLNSDSFLSCIESMIKKGY